MAPPLHRRALPFGRQARIPNLAPGAWMDPRGFGQAFRPDYQPDQITQQQLREELAKGVVPFDAVLEDLDANNLPAQLKQGKKLALLTQWGAKGAELLIPFNSQRRRSFVVSNFLLRNDVLFSYGKPMDTGANFGEGIPFGNYFIEPNGTVAVDDIWVFCNDVNETYPFYVCGYEGTIAPVGNKR